jgi:protocatechuate 3,4-dioxygenase beta subunit
MRIEDFPRPKDDNGRGLHWSASIYHPTGAALDFWINELQAMKIKWVKVLDDSGGSSLELCQRLLAADIMPVVRMYRGQPNPDTIGGREVEAIRRLVAAGARYFETNNEPDLPAEWRTRMPDNWLDIVVNNFIYDADLVLGAGGYLALPAMGPGSKDNPISMVVQKGRRDLFERGCWVAIHNYTLNHPLDYPDDDVNQLGTPLTQAEYDRFGAWGWDHRPIEMVNQLRVDRKNPGATIYDDPNCFRGYLWAARMIDQALGFAVPIISTEGGPVVGWGDDKRYPKMIPDQQKEWQVDLCRFFQEEAPDYYFACCTWLIASYRMGDFNPAWEQMSWYGNAWDVQFGLQGELPTVQALKDLPSVSRLGPRGNSVVTGRVLRQDTGQPLPLVTVSLQPSDAQSRARQTTTDDAGSYQFAQVAAGVYTLTAERGNVTQSIQVADNQTVEADLLIPAGSFSILSGLVVDSRGARQGNVPVRLLTILGDAVASTATDRDGHYRLKNLPTGTFRLEAAEGDQRVRIDGIALDGFTVRTLDITVPAPAGYVYAVVTRRLLTRDETQGRSAFYGKVLDPAGNGINGITLEMRWANSTSDAQFPRVRTGHDPFRPSGTYEFLHTRGEFVLQVMQGDWKSEIADKLITIGIPGREQDPITWEVNFQLRPVGSGQASAVRGQVAGGAEGTRLSLTEGQSGRHWTTTLAVDGRFAFTELGRGVYALAVEGIGVVRDGINLDGRYEAEVIFPMHGTIQGNVRGAPTGMTVMLSSLIPGWTWQRQTTTDALGDYRFAGLPASPYEIAVDPAHAVQAICDGLALFQAPPITVGQGSFSVLSGQVLDAQGVPQGAVEVQLWLDQQASAYATTDGGGQFAFAGLAAGTYELRVPSLQVTLTGIVLDGLSNLQVVLAPEGAQVAKVLPLYLLFGAPDQPGTPAALALAQPYLVASRATAGFSAQEAQRAEQVILVGDEATISAEVEHTLREAGCVVRRLDGDLYVIEEAFKRLLA